ncbi:Acetyltransferase (GNAT) family protein [Methylobacterium sp. ap11]|uniref:GNAT family N-acetyltransferase n=1 Tax=Methylobacterium sp. ap11 TaxID=1761799 RepID=UPI0008BA57FB|nr:GNAT family N-acetyltransferase [Methylobacterium sp. ap11]SEP45445.1 Acetyltransferase (GNAT) family protein [Methylobacterium sp. ap11]
MSGSLRLTSFDQVELTDPFFDSLKAQYGEFTDWFERKSAAKEAVYVVNDDVESRIRGFVYLKLEEGVIDDVDPPLPAARRLKVGTLKNEARGTKLGERIIKKVFDHAFAEDVEEIYVTVFDTHIGLIRLFEKYGFVERASKTTPNGQEIVLVRSLEQDGDNIITNYPLINTEGSDFFLLSIYPEYHTKLFPDSILMTEGAHIVEDLSHTNTIHKVYIGGCPLTMMDEGDIVVIYRTTDIPKKAFHRSVVTSVCVVEETRTRSDFATEDGFIRYCSPHSVFSEDELKEFYRDKNKRVYVAKLLYNAALPKRPNRAKLLSDIGMTDPPRFDLRRISREEFDGIVEHGELNPRLVL